MHEIKKQTQQRHENIPAKYFKDSVPFRKKITAKKIRVFIYSEAKIVLIFFSEMDTSTNLDSVVAVKRLPTNMSYRKRWTAKWFDYPATWADKIAELQTVCRTLSFKTVDDHIQVEFELFLRNRPEQLTLKYFSKGCTIEGLVASENQTKTTPKRRTPQLSYRKHWIAYWADYPASWSERIDQLRLICRWVHCTHSGSQLRVDFVLLTRCRPKPLILKFFSSGCTLEGCSFMDRAINCT